MTVTVRRATRDDSEIVAQYAMKLVEQHVAYDAVRFARIATTEGMAWFYGGQTEAENAAVFIADVDDAIVGFAYVGYEDISYQDLAVKSVWIHDIYVDEEARHTGAGRALIDAAIEFAKEHGASKLLLWTAARNLEARSFFEQAGFETTMQEMMLVVSD